MAKKQQVSKEDELNFAKRNFKMEVQAYTLTTMLVADVIKNTEAISGSLYYIECTFRLYRIC